MASQNKKKQNQNTIHFQNFIYRVLNERSINTVSFAWHLKFKDKMTNTYSLWVKSGRRKKKDWNTIHFEIPIYRVLHETSNLTTSSAELVRIWRINDFYTSTSGKQLEIKIEKLESGQYTFRNCFYRVVFKRSNKTGSFVGHLKFQEQSAFSHLFWVSSSKSK